MAALTLQELTCKAKNSHHLAPCKKCLLTPVLKDDIV